MQSGLTCFTTHRLWIKQSTSDQHDKLRLSAFHDDLCIADPRELMKQFQNCRCTSSRATMTYGNGKHLWLGHIWSNTLTLWKPENQKFEHKKETRDRFYSWNTMQCDVHYPIAVIQTYSKPQKLHWVLHVMCVLFTASHQKVQTNKGSKNRPSHRMKAGSQLRIISRDGGELAMQAFQVLGVIAGRGSMQYLN